MSAKRKAMRKIKEVLRLKLEAGLSHERIAAAVGVPYRLVSLRVCIAQYTGRLVAKRLINNSLT